MALSEFEIKRCEQALAEFLAIRRPPPYLRDKLDIIYRINGQSIELLEVRPDYLNPDIKMERAFAKTTFVKTQKVWKLYWMRASGKWHSYQPHPTAKNIEDILNVIIEDHYACFFG